MAVFECSHLYMQNRVKCISLTNANMQKSINTYLTNTCIAYICCAHANMHKSLNAYLTDARVQYSEKCQKHIFDESSYANTQKKVKYILKECLHANMQKSVKCIYAKRKYETYQMHMQNSQYI